jgi:hypothetical protein
MLVTLSDTSFSDIRLVSNSVDIVSRGNTYTAFPIMITLPTDSGDTVREAAIEFDNVSLELIDEIRSVVSPITAKIEIVLASLPDEVQIVYDELKIRNITYNKQRISARLYMDTFLNVELGSETYTPSKYPGLF